ncbi:MAG TPA: glutamate synthase-related protein [bacterium]
MLYKNPYNHYFDFIVQRDLDKCIRCKGCVTQCSYGANYYDEHRDLIYSLDYNCIGCMRCSTFCPTDCIRIVRNPDTFRPNANWRDNFIKDLYKQAGSGGIIVTGMGNDKPSRIYWDHMVIDACQVTNPSIDPLREPMELKTFLGRKPDLLEAGDGYELKTKLAPQLILEMPIMFSAMSYGSINYNVCESVAMAATELGTYWNTGEGGLPKSLYQYGRRTIVQCASGRFGVSPEYLNAGAAIEIKIGQGAKPGIGGHLPGEKVLEGISETRMIPVGTDAISPAPHHDIYSIEDLKQLIYALKEATRYEKPVSVKIAAVHNSAAIASGIARAGADIIAIDGFRGGTGAAPKIIRDNVGIPIEVAIASVDERLRQEGIRNQVSLVAAGGFRNSGDVIKAIALGADAVYIATSALMAVGCTLCQQCHRGRCAWGITTNDPDLAKRVNPEIGAERLVNLIRAWSNEIKEMLGLMGINSIESLKGNRDRLRGIGLTESELRALGIQQAGL